MKGSIRPRGKRSWEIRYDLPSEVDGKRNQHQETVHGTKRDAQARLNQILAEIQSGAHIEPAKQTLGQFLLEWLNQKQGTVGAKTYERYTEIINNHLIPALGHHQLPKLKPLHVQSYYADAQKSGRLDGSGGLSPKTVSHHHGVLHKALSDALKWQLINFNPAAAVTPPRVPRHEMKTLTPDEAVMLLLASQGTKYYVPVVLALTTGMRRGEIFGLKWDDIDFNGSAIRVRRSLSDTKQGLSYKDPKTTSARRNIALPDLAVKALRQHELDQEQVKRVAGDLYNDQGLVFADQLGNPINIGSWSSTFPRWIDKMNLPKVRFHDLRHTHVTLLAGQGVHVKTISARLGHSNISITMDTYGHVIPSMERDAASKIDDVLNSGSG